MNLSVAIVGILSFLFSLPQKRFLIEMALTLQDLIDDCLLEIFKNLTVFEMAKIASTCLRFKSIGRDAFTSRYKSKCLAIDVTRGKLKKNQYIARRRKTVAILRNFGDLLTNLKFTFCPSYGMETSNSFAFNLMVKYCTGSLERLELQNLGALHRDEIVDARSRLWFGNVKELILDDSAGIDGNFLSYAKKLTRLDLICHPSKDVVKFLLKDYPQLQSLTLHLDGRANVDAVTFLKRHPNLTELELLGGGVYDLLSIGECLWLRKLSIWNCQKCNIAPIAQLDKLTSLELSTRFGPGAIMEVFRTSRSSESLEELVFAGGMRHPRSAERFINLRYLSMVLTFADINDDFLLDIPRLEELRTLSIAIA